MAQIAQLRIQRQPEVLEQFGFKKSTLYNHINSGLMPSPISLGGKRAVGFIEHETRAVLLALCAGKPPEEIKQLVSELESQRSELF
jgi:predicted DNA-binding transcriptional regulator AlpA